MIDAFAHLSTEEQDALFDAIPRITILVAGADGIMDDDELGWAQKIANIRSYASSSALNAYYEAVDHKMSEKIHKMIDHLPRDKDERQKVVSDELAKLNAILPKLETDYRADLYKSWLSFARHIARASGGILGAMSVSPEEQAVMDLSMIDPVG